MDKPVLKILKMLAAAYPNFELTKERIRIFEVCLGDISSDVLEAAALKHVTECKWPPTVAELRDAAFDIVTGARHRLSGEEAWGEVRRAMSSVGFYATPEFTEPAIERAVAAAGGWKYLCSSEQAVADRARFIAAFDTISKRERADVRMLPALSQLEQKILEATVERDGELVPAERES